jgi:hypothetical protein
MYGTGVANPTELAMLTRVMDSLATEIGIEKSSDQYEGLASDLLMLFEASKDEKRLLTLMRRIAGVRSRPESRRSKSVLSVREASHL